MPLCWTPFQSTFHIRITRTAIIEQNRRADQQPADEQVPHHPPCRGIPEEPIVRFQIQPQSQAFQMFKEDSTLVVSEKLEPLFPRASPRSEERRVGKECR